MPSLRDRHAIQQNAEGIPFGSLQDDLWSDAFEHMGISVAQLDLDGKILSVNEYLCKTVGYSRGELQNRSFSEFFHSENSCGEPDSLARLCTGEIREYSTEMTAGKKDGSLLCVKSAFSLVRDEATHEPRRIVATMKDVTFLRQATQSLHDAELARDELSRRMMNAQDADRTRIARELHDDIGQSLAVLKIQMLRAGQPVSGRPDETHASLKDLAGKLEKITQKVSHLSHDLHSAELEFLGLAVAVKGCCRECSEQMQIPIHCHCTQIGETLNGITALAFLRVVQEAMHNVIKHSRATKATVRLSGLDGDLSLHICDDGVGFDPEATRLAAGLGLISMRERIHLIGGQFEICSRPGQGTQITARAPLSL